MKRRAVEKVEKLLGITEWKFHERGKSHYRNDFYCLDRHGYYAEVVQLFKVWKWEVYKRHADGHGMPNKPEDAGCERNPGRAMVKVQRVIKALQEYHAQRSKK